MGAAPASAGGQVGAAYDSIAAAYDGLVSEDAWMRERLWAHHLRVFPAGARVLDVACGTGLDTLHLAARGRRLTGVDASPGMLEALRDKAAALGLAGQVAVRAGDAGQLDDWEPASFDGILSSFAGLNTTDLSAFAAAAGRLVRPRGRVVIHLLAPAGIWERLRLAAAGSPGAALRLGRRRQLTVTIAGSAVTHHLLPAGDLYRRHFHAAFHLRRWYGLGWLWPRQFGARLGPRTARVLGGLDAALGRYEPWRRCARFLVLDLERRDDQAGPIERHG